MIALSNTLLVMLGTSLLGAVAAVVGSFAVLRRRALMGDLIAHRAARLVSGLLATQLSAVDVATVRRRDRDGQLAIRRDVRRRVRHGPGRCCLCDAAMPVHTHQGRRGHRHRIEHVFRAGVVLASLIQNLPTASSKAGLQTYIYGQAAGMTREDVRFIAIVAGACLVLVTLLYKEFQVFSFDPGFARAQGWPTLAIDMTMMGTLALVTVVGLPSVGVVLMAAMLIIPGAAARFWTNRLGSMLVIAGLIGAGSGVLGTMISAGTIEQLLDSIPWPLAITRGTCRRAPLSCCAARFYF